VAHADYDPTGDRVVVHTVWNQKDIITAVPGARFDAVNKYWVVPSAWASLVILRGVFGADLTLSKRLIDWAWKLRRDWVDQAMTLRVALNAPDDDSPEMNMMKSWRT